ncbi:Putative Zn-dependent protease, contains TPR repeats [Variovorax sp. NFACC28]|nr:Putative Zn-dependent protease, contains TPR repeats [Variovorax sp. NFACC28]SEG02498.1 Putative Zn-dependent protease, contains TPR repeats [Variovorax sp. NFACC29]SFB97689.1 Putative Zn-dependent protease, contains TPR repeats [Variovorax sp. NFACC26]SFF80167.1 Putative Zn-dependent protease, contains TPR repeats [Variovorax sp. NFACC27]
MPVPALAQIQQVLPGMGDGGEMTASAERHLGDQIARELYRDTDYIDDPVIAAYVQEIWQRLLVAARARGELTPELDERFAWTILLGRDRNINAFALPGGYLGLNLGLVAAVGSRDELATVLGHELSHVTQRHISRIMTRQGKQMPLMIAGLILGMIAASKSRNGDAGQAMIMGSQAMFAQNQLNFSRDMEREADRIGFGVMTQAGFAPQGAAAMFEKLQYASRLNDNGSYPYLRSHPLTTERISDMQGRFQFRMDAAPPLPLAMDHAMIASRARVLTRPGVDVLRLWIDAASSGEFAKSTPAQQAGTLYAAALSAKEMRDYKAARALVERLVARTADDPAAAKQARWLNAEIELAAGGAPKAAALLDVKSKERPEMLLAAEAATAMRQPAPMIPVLRDWVAANPRDATVWRALGNLYGAQNDTLRAVRADAEANVAILDYPAARDRFKAAQELVRQSRVVDHYEASIIDTRARAVEVLVKEQAAEPPLK